MLGETRVCTKATDWQAPGAQKLWIYNLHYFDDLNAREAQTRAQWHRNLLDRWVEENPLGHGIGWEPYPVSRRIVNWVKWAARGNVLTLACLQSLALQMRWLGGRLEYHILGNHLFANAKALVYAGLFFDGDEAERCYARGLKLVQQQLQEQVLADGGHFELSTMYHAVVLEDLLDLVNVLRAYGREPPGSWLTIVARMQRWLGLMNHPDGDIAFFNDAAFAVAPVAAQLDAYALRLGLPLPANESAALVRLETSGYVRAVAGPAFLLCDCAAVGPDHLPGHAHADTLSFELSLLGHRVLVNSGTSVYGTGAERQRQRGTAAHNTVVVNGCDSTEVWGGFRVARRARASLHGATSTGEGVIVDASHDGYRRQRGNNEHRRRWTLTEEFLCIEDQVTGNFDTAEACLHLHPDIGAILSTPFEVMLRHGSQSLGRITFEGAAAIDLVSGTWHPRFGATVSNLRIVARFAGATLVTRVLWSLVAEVDRFEVVS
ncbi:MAG: heparinase II/III family protein [Steroidobacteraceae bacterium]